MSIYIGDFLSVKVGDKAPDFTLPSQMGDNVTLSEFFGKKTLFYTFIQKMKRLAAQGKHAVSEIATKN